MTDRSQRPLTEADARYGAARSRRLLVDAISALDAFADAVTVVGAHAVHVWVQEAWGPIDMETDAADEWLRAFQGSTEWSAFTAD